MNNWCRKTAYVIVLLLVIVFLFVTIMPALANDINAEEQRLEEVRRQMETQQNKAASAQQKVNSVAEQLRIVQTELDNARSEYKAIQDKLSYTEEQIRVNEELLKKTEASLNKRTQILYKRMRDVYKNGQVSYLDVLVGATDFNDFATRMELLKHVMKQDLVLMETVKAERELIVTKKAELENDKASILELKKQITAKKALVEKKHSEREAVLNQAVNERDVAERAYQELLDQSRQIEQMLRNLKSGVKVGESSGAMIWPYRGIITSEYGWRTHPIFGTERYHSGLDIAGDYGETVKAADGGVVVYADWMGGYGKAVIIDHGNGISTLYAHNSELVVSEGQRVTKGQQIALIGSTGYSTGPHVHFEVRENGSPVSPHNYLP